MDLLENSSDGSILHFLRSRPSEVFCFLSDGVDRKFNWKLFSRPLKEEYSHDSLQMEALWQRGYDTLNISYEVVRRSPMVDTIQSIENAIGNC